MFIVKFKDRIEDETHMSEPFKTIEGALAYAKRKYFEPNAEDGWYNEDAEEFLVPDYQSEHPEVKDIKDVAEIDYKEFAKKHKFTFNDGMYDCGTLTIVEKK